MKDRKIESEAEGTPTDSFACATYWNHTRATLRTIDGADSMAMQREGAMTGLS